MVIRQRYHKPKYRSILVNLLDWLRDLYSAACGVLTMLFLNSYLQMVILLAQALWLILALLLITYWPLSAMDQANDAFRALVNEKPNWAFFGHLTAFGFALTVWFCCRMLFIRFKLKRLQERVNLNPGPGNLSDNALQQFTKWVPPLLGTTPLLIFAGGLDRAENSTGHILLVLFVLLTYFYVTYINNDFIIPGKQDYLSPQEYVFKDLRIQYRWANYSIGALTVVLFIAFAWYEVNVVLTRIMGVIAVFFVAMSLWVFLAYLLTRLDYSYRVPISIVVLAILIFFWNTNNHQIQTHPEGYFSKRQADSLGIGPHFARWVASRHDSICSWEQNPKNQWQAGDSAEHRSDRYPVYIIASEGGGLRAAYWTASVLGQLSQRIPHFYERVYALSTVSGGSVGGAVYTKLYRDSLAAGRSPAWAGQTVYSKAKTILQQDYLSPLVGAFLLPDMAQKLWPFGIRSFDRARYLENSLSDEYARVAGGSGSLDTPFLHIWSGQDENSYSYRVPALFLNCTRVEDGQKAILSNLQIKGQAFQGINNQNVIDLQERIYKHVPIKTAAFMSARFPIVTPPATIQANTTGREDMMTIVDGGYIDNSGLETALAVITSIRQSATEAMCRFIEQNSTTLTQTRKNDLIQDLNRIELHLILIKTSEQSDEERVPNRGLYEIRGPLTAFFNSWDINIGSKLNVAREYLHLAANEKVDTPITSATNCTNKTPFVSVIPVDKELILFDLDRKQQTIPLGWFLSDTAQRCVNRQAELIHQRFDPLIEQRLAHRKLRH